MVKNREFIPADMVLLASSEGQSCHVMTANLGATICVFRAAARARARLRDQPRPRPYARARARARRWETNLKIRDVHLDFVREVQDGVLTKNVSTGKVECDLPNDKLEVFEGRLELAGGKKIPLGPRNVLLRGCTLRQTDWVVGVVIYAGAETKIQMNASEPPRKTSALMIYTNAQTKIALIVMVSECDSHETGTGLTMFLCVARVCRARAAAYLVPDLRHHRSCGRAIRRRAGGVVPRRQIVTHPRPQRAAEIWDVHPHFHELYPHHPVCHARHRQGVPGPLHDVRPQNVPRDDRPQRADGAVSDEGEQAPCAGRLAHKTSSRVRLRPVARRRTPPI